LASTPATKQAERIVIALHESSSEVFVLAQARSPEVPAGCAAFETLERRLVIATDEPEILEYLRSAYRRVSVAFPGPDDVEAVDRGEILAHNGAFWLTFNGAPVPFPDGLPKTPFRRAFYGSSKLMRASFRRTSGWHSIYAAALRVRDKAVIVLAPSGIGKTTLALELMARGAGFLSDEFVFVRKADNLVRGLPRAMLIRERTLALFDNPTLRAVCEASSPRMPYGDRVWDNIDPGDVFGEEVFAEPAPLALVVVLERRQADGATVEEMPSAVAAADLCARLNAEMSAFDRLADAALLLSGIPCYRIAASKPRCAADALVDLIR
jgi:hypothetical protein